jgi:hypothetical protein
MASTTYWVEYNVPSGSPANVVQTPSGTPSSSIGYSNWMYSDQPDTTGVLYRSYPIPSGNGVTTYYSCQKVQALYYTGTYNALSSLTFKVSSNSPASNTSLVASVISAWSAPGGTGYPAAGPFTATGDSAASTTGTSAGFGTGSYTSATSPTTGPFSTAGGSSTTTNPIYSNAYRTQLQSLGPTPPGDVSTVTITATWTES